MHKILQLLEDKGLISSPSSYCPSSASSLAKDTRDQVVLELLSTERKYVQDLEILQVSISPLKYGIIIIIYLCCVAL